MKSQPVALEDGEEVEVALELTPSALNAKAGVSDFAFSVTVDGGWDDPLQVSAGLSFTLL